LVGQEQNIYHADAGSLDISETSGGQLQRGTILMVGVVNQYGIGFPLSISRYDYVTDAVSGLGLRVRDITPPPMGTGAGTAIQWIIFEVMSETDQGAPGGTITLDGLTLFGHVYNGERYHLVVTGPAVAENHRPIWGGTQPVGLFNGFPYAVYDIVEQIGEGGITRAMANSLAGVDFDSTRNASTPPAPEIIWERLPGMVHEGGFVQARHFADVAGVDAANIVWNNASGEAIIRGWDYQGNWITVILTRNSPNATIMREGEATLFGDIATISPGTADAGTITPVFRNDRIYLPLRFLFNVFGYSAHYNFERVGTRVVITPF
jgi:hypothetical protein